MNIDIHSATWLAIKQHLADRLNTCRTKNDNPKLTEADTAALRGEIQALKDLLDLPKLLAAQAVFDDPGYGAEPSE